MPTTPTGAAIPPVCQAVVDLVKHFEGLYLTAYRCPAGVWTIGYGHTAGVTQGQSITGVQAENLLRADLADAGEIVAKAVKVPLLPHQAAALKSFVFNVGPGRKGVKDGFVVLKNGKPSTLLTRINAKDWTGAAAEFAKWRLANGQVLPGLVTRRHAEELLFRGQPWRDALAQPMPQAVEPAPTMKPLTESRTVQVGGLSLTLAAVTATAQQLKEASGTIREVVDLLPPGGAGWVAAGILALGVGVMLIRRYGDKRKAVA